MTSILSLPLEPSLVRAGHPLNMAMKTHKDGALIRLVSDNAALALAAYTTVIPESATEIYDATFRHAGGFP